MKHKTALATAASITGVLLASATAFAANTGPDDNPSTSDLTESSTSTSSSSTNPSTSALAAPVGAQPTAVPAANAPIVYQLTGIADITLTRSGDTGLTVLGVVPAAGWTQSNHVRGEGIEVELTSSTEKVEFKAWVVNGQIQTDVEREGIGPSSSGATKTSVDDRSSDDDSYDDRSYDDRSYDDNDDRYDDSDSDDDDDDDDDDESDQDDDSDDEGDDD